VNDLMIGLDEGFLGFGGFRGGIVRGLVFGE
jgi:hypothetical protein